MITDVTAWSQELLFTGNIVQDGDSTVARDEAVRRAERYLDLVNMVTGTEDNGVFLALITSLQSPHDYGAYDDTFGKIESFPEEYFGLGFIKRILPLLPNRSNWAGRLLLIVCRSPGRIAYFNAALSGAPSRIRRAVMEYISSQEQPGGWLEYDCGMLRPSIVDEGAEKTNESPQHHFSGRGLGRRSTE
jgi:hypothetical protein